MSRGNARRPDKRCVRHPFAALAILAWIYLTAPTPAHAQTVGGACSVASGSTVLSNGVLLICNGSTWTLGEGFTSSGDVIVNGTAAAASGGGAFNFTAYGSSTNIAAFVGTEAHSSSAGSGMIGYSDSGAALSSGDRLGFFLLGGAYDGSHDLNNSAGMVSFATQAWSSSGAGANLEFMVQPNNTTTSANRITAMTIDQTGYVGIGTTGPSYPLDAYSSGNTPIREVSTNDGGDVVLLQGAYSANGTYENGAWYFEPNNTLGSSYLGVAPGNGSPTAAFLENGSVGIGTTVPNYTLDVNGTVNVGTQLILPNAGSSYVLKLSGKNSGIYVPSGGDAMNFTIDTAEILGISANTITLGAPLDSNSVYESDIPNSRYLIAVNNGSGAYNQGIYWYNSALSFPNNSVGIKTITPQSTLDVSGNVSIGAYGGSNAAPSNGLIVSGDVGIGTTSPNYTLQVAGNAYVSGNFWIASPIYDANNSGYYVQPSNLSGLYELDVSYLEGGYMLANIYGAWECLECVASGGYYTYANVWSDRRLKTDIKDFDTATDNLSRLMKLKPVRFRWKDRELDSQQGEQIGFLAQEVEKIYPELVQQGKNTMSVVERDGTKETIEHPKLVNYEKLVVPAIQAIQQQQDEIAELKAANDIERKKITELQGANDNQAAAIAALQTQLTQLTAASRRAR